jgi:DNA-binding NtrC family response regulator
VSARATVLLIAPDTGDRHVVAAILERHGHIVVPILPAEGQSQLSSGQQLDVVIVDLAGGPESLRLLRSPAARRASTPIICIADRRKPDASSEALRLGVADLVGRPVQEDDLLAALSNAREFARIAAAPPESAPAVELPTDSVFGASPAIREVLALVRRLATSRCAVLIVGERGTGREMVARAIHAQGRFADNPFMKITCTVGAEDDLRPLFQGDVPAGATVYLENVNELPADLQYRLAQHIQRPEVAAEPALREAASAPASADIRFIGAAPPRISDLVDRGAVRRDLIDALSVVRIELPPLRERSEDVSLLATHFLKDACRRNEVPLKAFSRFALILLGALPWPGNAAELRSLCERLAVIVPRGVVLLEDVLANVRFEGAEAMGRSRGSLREARERFERDYVVAILQHHRGRVGAAARELGIERTNLYRKIKQLRITWTTGAE